MFTYILFYNAVGGVAVRVPNNLHKFHRLVNSGPLQVWGWTVRFSNVVFTVGQLKDIDAWHFT